jgi:hypothetical protein
MKQCVYLDTNVYINWARGNKLTVLRRLERNGVRVFLTPTAVIETIEDFWFTRAEDIRVYRRAVKLMLRHGARRVLPPSETFTFNVLRVHRKRLHSPNLTPRHLRRWLQFAAGLPRGLHNKATWKGARFDRGAFKSQVDAYRQGYVDMLIATRAAVLAATGLPPDASAVGKTDRNVLRKYFGTPDWKNFYFKRMVDEFAVQNTSTAKAVDMCAAANSAAFELDTAILDLTLTAGYKPEIHRGDIFDQSLLTYLADPELIFVTADAKMAGRVVSSPQRHRICVI